MSISELRVVLFFFQAEDGIRDVLGSRGLGDIAYRYGYQRFDMQVMLAVILVLIVLVMLVQTIGDNIAKQLDKRKV